MNKSHNKDLDDYRQMMFCAFQEYYRILKPGHWITVEFHNSQNSVGILLIETIGNAGFIIAHIQVLDKRKVPYCSSPLSQQFNKTLLFLHINLKSLHA